MRKLVMTVLTLALILGSISVASAASGKVKLTDIADNANEEAIQVAYDLNIVEGTPEGSYEPEKAVNRAEFAALITRALAIPQSALASYSNTTFKDTAGYSWAVPYLAILQQRGIMKGDGYGNAMPGRTITPNEAVTMVLRAIGYTDNASVLVGQWPANYVALGQSQLLYEKVANDLEMNKASAAQMIYNVLTAQLVQVDANSTVKYLYDSDNSSRLSLLTTGLNCYGGGKTVVNFADMDNSKINLSDRVGAYGILYKSNVDDEIVALTEVETTFLAGKFTYTNDGNLDKFEAVVGGTKYSFGAQAKAVVNDVTSVAAISSVPGLDDDKEYYYTFFNGNDGDSVKNYSTRYTDGTNATAAGKTDNAAKIIIAARVSGVTVQEIRSIAVWDADRFGDTFLYEAGQIDNNKFNGHAFPLDTNNERDDSKYTLAGVNTIDDIAADNVIYVYKDAAGNAGKIRRIEVGAETQSGVVTNVGTTVTIGGKALSKSPYRTNSANYTDAETPGNEGMALLDIYSRIYDFKLGDAFKGNFAILLDSANYFGDQAKIYDKTGSEVIYSVTSNLTLATLNAHKDKLIEYKLSAGKLDSLPQQGTPITAGNGHINAAGTILTFPVSGSSPILIDSGVVVFVYDSNGDYSLGNIKDLVDDDIDNTAYYIKSDNKIKALLVSDGDAGAQKVFVMIEAITKGWNNNGDVDIVRGIDFAKGANSPTNQTWNYTNANLHDSTLLGLNGLAETTQRGRYGTMVQFKIGEDGVLRDARTLTSVTGQIGPAGYIGGGYTSGVGGTFSVEYTTNGGISTAEVAFEPNTVLYKMSGSSAWEGMRPTEANFKLDVNNLGVFNGQYIFLKTDAKKAYDVIIKIN
jgi:hypothetical protein